MWCGDEQCSSSCARFPALQEAAHVPWDAGVHCRDVYHASGILQLHSNTPFSSALVHKLHQPQLCSHALMFGHFRITSFWRWNLIKPCTCNAAQQMPVPDVDHLCGRFWLVEISNYNRWAASLWQDSPGETNLHMRNYFNGGWECHNRARGGGAL